MLWTAHSSSGTGPQQDARRFNGRNSDCLSKPNSSNAVNLCRVNRSQSGEIRKTTIPRPSSYFGFVRVGLVPCLVKQLT